MPVTPAARTAVAALSSLALIGGIAVATPGLAAATAPVSSSHPYSDPIWYPLSAEVKVDCVKANPGCLKPHDFWGMDVLPNGQSARGPLTSRATVNAMGAGIAHIGNAKGDACPAADTSFGTWVWVDHGGGTISRYGHISTILVSDGQLVAPGAPLGVVGVSGKSSNCWNAYTDFMLRRNGKSGPSYEFKTLKACTAAGRVTWPTALGFARWNDVPKGTIVPASGDGCRPTAVPPTANKPGSVALATSGVGRLKATWAKPPVSAGVDKIRVEFGEYHPSKGTWDYQQNERWYDLSPTTTSKTLKSLTKKHKWRVRVHFHNAGGWSAASSWSTSTVK